MADLLVIGGYGIGMSFFTEHAPRDGETVSGARLSEEHGGKASNQAVGASRLGASVALVTALGTDGREKAARELWDSADVDHSAVMVIDGTTMIGAIITDASGENRIILADGVLDEITAEQMDTALTQVKEPRLALISCEIGDESIEAAIRHLHARDVPVIVNPAPVPNLPAEVWAMVDTLTPNETEASDLLAALGDSEAVGDPVERAQKISELLGANVVMTLGSAGSVIVEKDDPATSTRVDAVRVPNAIDTTGAGDSFNAGLATALLNDDDFATAAVFGAHAAACTVEREGVIPALPTRQMLTERFGI